MQTFGVSVVTIITFAVIARIISTEQMGIWAILLLINATCITFATWFTPAVTKYVAENVAKGSKDVAGAAFYQALRANFLIYLPVIVGMFFGATFLASHLLGNLSYAPLFRLLAFDVFLSASLVNLAVAALLGLRMFKEAAVVGLVVGGVLRQLLIVSLVLLMKNILGLVIGWLLSDLVWVAILLVIVIRALGAPRFDFPLVKLFRFYWPLELGQIVSFAQTWFDRVLLVIFVPLAALGVYNAAVTAFAVLANVSASLSSMLFPVFSSIQNKEERSGMVDAVRLATRYSNFVLTPLAFGLLALAKPALTLFVGEAYVAGYLPLAILSGAFAFVAFTAALPSALMALEETKLVGSITAISVLLGLFAAYLLLPAYGIVGASAARGLSMLVGGVLVISLLSRKIAVHLDFGSIAKPIFASSLMAIVLFGIQLVHYTKFMLPVYVVIGMMIYIISLRLLKAVDQQDMELVRGFLGRRLELLSRILSWMLVTTAQGGS
jgi:O-antigen/teichoic acid export membrane protein